MNNNKVVYRHRRNDTNAIFYVGMGNVKRPFSNNNRNNYWNNIVNKAGYTIEVVADKLSREDALELENFMILEYGLDNLCNLTTGGECPVHSEKTKLKLRAINLGKKLSAETKKKLSLLNKGNKHSDESKRKISISQKGLQSGGKNPNAKPVVNIITGEKFGSLREAVDSTELNYSTIRNQLQGVYKIQPYNPLRYL